MSDSIIELDRAEEVAGLPCAAGVPAVTEATWRQHRPAVHVAAMRDGVCVARCSLWMQQTLTLDGRPVAVLGHYAAAG